METPRTTPSRRWLQFGLGMLLAVLTACACLFAYEANWIRARRAFLEAARSELGTNGVFVLPSGGGSDHQAPSLLGLFGEEGIDRIVFNFNLPEADPNAATGSSPQPARVDTLRLKRAKLLFPEASVSWGGYSKRAGP